MAAQQKKRQKKLERRSAQRKQRQKTLINKKNRGLAEQMAAASSCPVLHSYISETVWDDGLGGGLGGVTVGVTKVTLVKLTGGATGPVTKPVGAITHGYHVWMVSHSVRPLSLAYASVWAQRASHSVCSEMKP